MARPRLTTTTEKRKARPKIKRKNIDNRNSIPKKRVQCLDVQTDIEADGVNLNQNPTAGRYLKGLVIALTSLFTMWAGAAAVLAQSGSAQGVETVALFNPAAFETPEGI